MKKRPDYALVVVLLTIFPRVAAAQAPPPCFTFFSATSASSFVTTKTLNVGSESSTQTVNTVLSNGYPGSCTISTTAPAWITVSPTSVTAPPMYQILPTFTLTIEANPGPQRVGTVTLGNATVTVTQSGTNVPVLPASPTLTASVNGTLVTLSWTPTGNTYLLEAGTGSGLSNVLVSNLGAATTLSATGAPGTYYVRVRGINAAGTGPASNEAVVILGGCAAPATPAGQNLRSVGTAVTFSWTPTAGATSYVVQAGTSPGDSSLFNGNVGAATTVAGTLPSGTYFVRVLAVNACGRSSASPDSAVTVP